MTEFDQYAARYQEMLRDPVRERFANGGDFFHRRKWDMIRDYFAARGRDTCTMDWLDAGCGQGELLAMGGAHFRSAAGCDPSQDMLAEAGSDAPRIHEVRTQAEPTELPFPDQSFDFVTAVCVYHHVKPEDRARLTQSIHRVLRPGGVFCMIEHNPWNPATRLIVKRCAVDADAQLLSATEARRVARAGWMDPRQTSYFLFFPESMHRRCAPLESALRGMPVGGQYALFSQKS